MVNTSIHQFMPIIMGTPINLTPSALPYEYSPKRNPYLTPIISESIPIEKQVSKRKNNFLFHLELITSKTKLNNKFKGVLCGHDVLV